MSLILVAFKIFTYVFLIFTKILCLDVALFLCMLLEIWHFEYEDSYYSFLMGNMELLFFQIAF